MKSRLRGGGQGGVFTRAAGEPVVITATGFAYDGDSGVAVYRGEAVLRSGEDQVSSDSIRIAGDAGRRRLEARGGVESVFQSRAEPAKTGAAGAASEAVRARASEMVYDEAARTIVYTGEVALQQGDIRTRSPRATVSLAAAGSRVEQPVAGEPVDVVQGPRTASGRMGTYHPADGTMHLTGGTGSSACPDIRWHDWVRPMRLALPLLLAELALLGACGGNVRPGPVTPAELAALEEEESRFPDDFEVLTRDRDQVL